MNPNNDREFFESWKRVFSGKSIGADGMPTLTAKDINRPKKSKIVKSNGANWSKLVIPRPVYISTPDGRQIDFINGHHPGDLSGDTAKPWNSSVTGSAKLYAPGMWHFKTPLVGTDVEGKFCTLVIRECPSGLDGANLTAGDLVGALASQQIDLIRLGGTTQTGADLGSLVVRLLARFLPLTLGVPTDLRATTADRLVFAANAARRGLLFYNYDTVNTIAIGTRNPMTGMKDALWTLAPGEGIYLGPLEFVTTQELRSWADGASAVNNLLGTEGI